MVDELDECGYVMSIGLRHYNFTHMHSFAMVATRFIQPNEYEYF